MTASSVARKLGLKPNMRALIVAAPAEYMELLALLPEGVTISRTGKGSYPFLQLFAKNIAEVKKSAPKLLQHADANTIFWICYPKQTSGIAGDLNRDILREAMNEFSWHAVSIVAIDEVWSALRFRPGRDA